MIKLFTKNEYENTKSRDKLPLECMYCHKTFYKEKNQIRSSINGLNHAKMNCCSNECSHLFTWPPKIIICDFCGNKVRKIPSEIRKNRHSFCNQSCAAKYHNAHKTTCTKVSKMEIWIQEQLQLLYPTPDFFTFNKRDAINSELDIYIPSLKLAFELNGIFHYEPIYGNKKLSSTQLNDERKFKLCSDNNISLCIIDISSVKYYKPKNMQKFLDIIVKIIEEKIDSKTGVEPS